MARSAPPWAHRRITYRETLGVLALLSEDLGRSVEERRSSGGFWPTCALEVSEDLGKAGELRPDLWGVGWENKGLEVGYGVTV